MAQEKGGAEPAEREPTQRMVLRQAGVLVLPEGASTEQIIAAWKALGGKGQPQEQAAWVTVGEFIGKTKEDAIEAHTGRPGTADARTGTFKAPTVKAWSGGLRLRAPEKPLVQKEAIE